MWKYIISIMTYVKVIQEILFADVPALLYLNFDIENKIRYPLVLCVACEDTVEYIFLLWE